MTIEPMPTSEAARPGVIKWFRAYCRVLCLLYLVVAAASLPFFLADPAALEMSRGAARLLGVAILAMGLGLLAASLVPLVVRPRPWLWTWGLVLIGLGMTSACFLPACIPLLIYWIKPDVKQYFGRS